MTLLCLATHLHGSAAVVYPSLSAQCTREDQFINAVREGNETLVQSLILQGANACHTDSNGLNAMHHAVSSGKYGLISFLKEHRVPLNSKNSAGQTPIGLAISLGSLESVQTLISCGASLDEKDSEGNTPLLFAVKLGRTEAAQLIFSKETNYDRVNNQGEHLMHLAVKFPWLVSRFLDLGISADIQDLAGRLPIHHAARVGNLDSLRLLYAKSLMRKGADKEGMTCVHTAALHGHEACVEFLLKEGGADANSVDTIRGRTPLHYAAEVGAANTLQKLLDFGANRYAQDINGATALHLAAASGSQECIKALAPRTIQSSVLRATDKQKRTALHYAVLAKQRESVQTLLAMNISKDDQDSEGQTAFQIACEQGDANIGEDLLKAKAMIASKNLKGQTPLFSAVMSGNIALVKRLVETGNNRLVQLFSREIRYIDEVHQAVVQDNVAILKVLVAAGGSLTALDQGKNTLIHTAAAHNALACLAYLFSQKCSDSEFNQEGLTPLHVALKKGHQEVIALFSKRKALTVPSLAKRSPLQYAIDQVYQAYDEQSNVHATIAQNCFIELLKAGAPLTSR